MENKIIIDSDFDLKKNSVYEFIRVLIPELTEGKIIVKTLYENDSIKLKVKMNGNKVYREYKNIIDYIPDQKTVMLKTALLKLCKKEYKWGSFIGVRPTKPVRKLMGKGLEMNKIKEILTDLYILSEEKANFLLEVVQNSQKYINSESISIYIGIPFCPTKCKYCSFASYTVTQKYKERYREFLEKLFLEIEIVGDLLRKKRYSIESIYIGGGTPTILSESDLDTLLSKVNKSFDLNNLKEFTLEAGRIDTITESKLDIAKKYKVDRLSLNPQTFKKSTLDEVNRYWNEEEFKEIYKLSKDKGFIINMDLILGLPGEDTEDILKNIEKLNEYLPENLTFHTLALKKASNLFQEGHKIEYIDYNRILGAINEYNTRNDLYPYYTYRQKNSIESGENVGYAKLGKESIFNIVMIDEVQTTVGLGGGAISKFIKNGAVKRLINPKDPIVYIEEFENRLGKKLELINQSN